MVASRAQTVGSTTGKQLLQHTIGLQNTKKRGSMDRTTRIQGKLSVDFFRSERQITGLLVGIIQGL